MVHVDDFTARQADEVIHSANSHTLKSLAISPDLKLPIAAILFASLASAFQLQLQQFVLLKLNTPPTTEPVFRQQHSDEDAQRPGDSGDSKMGDGDLCLLVETV